MNRAMVAQTSRSAVAQASSLQAQSKFPRSNASGDCRLQVNENLYAERVLRAGARGYITKQQATRDIVQAIRRVLGGGIYLNETTATAVLDRLAAKPQGDGDAVLDLLTDRELQVFELTGQGFNTREIAKELRIDMKTVETYRLRIKEKLNLESSSDLLKLAIRWKQDRL